MAPKTLQNDAHLANFGLNFRDSLGKGQTCNRIEPARSDLMSALAWEEQFHHFFNYIWDTEFMCFFIDF